MRPESAPDRPRLAIVLAGGSGRRLGSVDKPALRSSGRTLLDIALAAVEPALTVVVGPTRALGPEILQTRERPPGGGPCAALAAGMYLLAESGPGAVADDALVAVLAADLPGIDSRSLSGLCSALRHARVDGAVLADPSGRDQYLAGVWRFAVLLSAVKSRASWDGGRIGDLLAPLIGVRVPADRYRTADVDTPADLARWGIERSQRGGGC